MGSTGFPERTRTAEKTAIGRWPGVQREGFESILLSQKSETIDEFRCTGYSHHLQRLREC